MIWEARNLPCKFAVICFKVQPNRDGNLPWPLNLPRMGADVTLQADQGETVLHLAAQHGKAELVTLLLGCLAKPPQRDVDRDQVWHSQFSLGSFIEAQNGPKRAFIRLMIEGLELVFLFDWSFGIGFPFFCLLVDKWIFSNDTQVDVKGIQDAFLILLGSCDPTAGHFWISRAWK